MNGGIRNYTEFTISDCVVAEAGFAVCFDGLNSMGSLKEEAVLINQCDAGDPDVEEVRHHLRYTVEDQFGRGIKNPQTVERFQTLFFLAVHMLPAHRLLAFKQSAA